MSSLSSRRRIKPSKPLRIPIDVACNDPDNGIFAGRIAQIHVGGGALELTANNWSILSFRGCPTIREDGGDIIVSGKRWQTFGSIEWIGNWCWNRYWFESTTATNFLTWLHKRNLFHCEAGWSELYAAWDLPAPLVLPANWWLSDD